MKDYCLVLSIRKKLKLSGWLMITTDHQHSLSWLIIVICTQTWFWIYSYGHWSHLDCSQQVLGRVVDPWNDITEALGVGGPQNNDFVHTTGLTEVSYVSCNSLHLEDRVLFETNCKRKKSRQMNKKGGERLLLPAPPWCQWGHCLRDSPDLQQWTLECRLMVWVSGSSCVVAAALVKTSQAPELAPLHCPDPMKRYPNLTKKKRGRKKLFFRTKQEGSRLSAIHLILN